MNRMYLLLPGAACLVLLFSIPCRSQEKTEPVPFGDFEQWLVREIKESGVIGGQTKFVYEVAPDDSIKGSTPYTNRGTGSQWGTSNAMAKVAGVIKTSNTVFPEARESGGRCARMDTFLEKVKVLGIVNISVVVSGSIFLGETMEPIRGASDPLSKIRMGIPFSRRPKALLLDYKALISNKGILNKATGGKATTLQGQDCARAFVLLQNRWEDSEGNIFAKRVGTGMEWFYKSTNNWVNGHRIDILYGDITRQPGYKPYMHLLASEESYYDLNSAGKIVPVQEVGWGAPDEEITHLVLMISSGNQGAYVGALGNSFWVDNIKLVYDANE